MFSVSSNDGDLRIQCNPSQLLELFPTAKLNSQSIKFLIDQEVLQSDTDILIECDTDSDTDTDINLHCTVKLDMDPTSKKFTGKLLPSHHIFNNPNISITPSLPSSRQSSIASANLPLRKTVPVSPPVSIVPVSCDKDKLVLKSKEIHSNSKRTASNLLSHRSIKQPRLSSTLKSKTWKNEITLSTTSSKPNLAVEKPKIKKYETLVSNINASTSIPATSNLGIRGIKDSSHVQSTIDEIQQTNSKLNCVSESTNSKNIDKNLNEYDTYQFMANGEFKFEKGRNKNQNTDPQKSSLYIKTDNEIFKISRSDLVSNLLDAVGEVFTKKVANEELDVLRLQNSKLLKYLKLRSETKNVSPTSSKSSPTPNNIVSNSIKSKQDQINQPKQIVIKSPKQTIDQPSKQINKLPNITKQPVITSPCIPSKIQSSSTTKKVPSTQLIDISSKHSMATATTQIPTSNKQIINSSPLPTSSKPLIAASTTFKVPTIATQTVKDKIMCIKCKVLSEDEVCQACRMSSQLKNVTVTRIETPSTSAVIAAVSPPDVPVDAPKSPKNSESYLLLASVDLLSDEDDDSTSNIPKIATKEEIKNYTDQLNLNPKILDDMLWQTNLSLEDYFKIEGCHSIHIGSFKTKPPPSGEMLLCVHGIRMTVLNVELNPVTIDVQMDNIVKIAYYYENNPLIIIYTNHLSSAGIQYLLDMNEDDESHYYNSLSEDPRLNKIIWFFDKEDEEQKRFKHLLVKLPKRKIESLTISQVNNLVDLVKDLSDEEITLLQTEKNLLAADSTIIMNDKINNIIFDLKVSEYKMLSTNEFVNDNLIEIYLNYWYFHNLSEEDRNRTYVFSPHFYTSLTNLLIDKNNDLTGSMRRHKKVKKWTKKIDIFQKDFIFIPVNENHHWYLAVICFPYLTGKVDMKDGTPVNIPDNQPDSGYQQQQYDVCNMNPDRYEAVPKGENFWLFDPKTTQNPFIKMGTDYHADVAKLKKQNRTLIKQPCIIIFDSLTGGYARARVATTLREWLDEEYRSRYKDQVRDFSANTVKGALVKVPQQQNTVDCGFFVMHFFQKFFERPIVDYNFPIYHLENWFSVDEVSKNCQKRSELQDILLKKIAVGKALPAGMALPVLDLRDPRDVKHSFQYHQISTQNSMKPTTSQYVSRQHVTTRHNNRHLNSQYYEEIQEESDESIDEDDVNNQFSENDQYDDERINAEYEEEEYLNNDGEYYSEMVEGDIDEEEVEEEEEEEEEVEEEEDDEESYGQNYDVTFNEYNQNMYSNRNIVEAVGSGSSNHRNLINIRNNSNENFQSFRPNNRIVYQNENGDEDDVDEEEQEEEEEEEEDDNYDDDEVDHSYHYDDDDDYNEPTSTTNHRRDNHFNNSRLSN